MSARNTISLKNWAAVEQAFTPAYQNGNQIMYVEGAYSSYEHGKPRLSIQSKLATGNRSEGVDRVSYKLTLPSLNAEFALANTGIVEVNYVLPVSMSQAARRELHARVRDLLQDAIVTAAVCDGDHVW